MSNVLSGTEQQFYALADFLGLSLYVETNEVTGGGKLKAEIGLARLNLTAEIRCGITNEDRTHVALLIAVGTDLGMVVLCEMTTKKVTVGLFNRRMVAKLTGLIKGLQPTDTIGISNLLADTKPRYFVGTIGKEFKPA